MTAPKPKRATSRTRGKAANVAKVTRRKRPGAKKVGDGYKVNDELKGRFLAELATGSRRTVAARAVGVVPRTMQRAALADPEFAEAMAEAESEGIDKVEDALVKTALGGNVVAQQIVLYNRRPDEWKDQRGRAAAEDRPPMDEDEATRVLAPVLGVKPDQVIPLLIQVRRGGAQIVPIKGRRRRTG